MILGSKDFEIQKIIELLESENFFDDFKVTPQGLSVKLNGKEKLRTSIVDVLNSTLNEPQIAILRIMMVAILARTNDNEEVFKNSIKEMEILNEHFLNKV
jgi:hypothetical protein